MRKIAFLIFAVLLYNHTNAQDDAKQKSSLREKIDNLRAPKETPGERKLPLSDATSKVTYTEVIEAKGLSNNELFSKAKKWVASKNSEVNPYTISYENLDDGTLIGKGTFALGTERKKYVVQFAMKILTKADKAKYEFTDLMIQHRTSAGSSGGGFGYYSGSSYKEAETLEYSVETFYPSRLTSKKPPVRYYEEIDGDSFGIINREMNSIAGSLKQALSAKDDW